MQLQRRERSLKWFEVSWQTFHLSTSVMPTGASKTDYKKQRA